MEEYSWQQQEHKNRNPLKKHEEIFWMVSLFVTAVFFIFLGFSIETPKNSQFVAITTSYRQFSIVTHAYAQNK